MTVRLRARMPATWEARDAIDRALVQVATRDRATSGRAVSRGRKGAGRAAAADRVESQKYSVAMFDICTIAPAIGS